MFKDLANLYNLLVSLEQEYAFLEARPFFPGCNKQLNNILYQISQVIFYIENLEKKYEIT